MDANKSGSSVNKLFNLYLEEISNESNAEEYLRLEGLSPDDLVEDSLRQLRQHKMKLASLSIEKMYSSTTTNFMAKAKEQAKKLMEGPSFDFNAFIKKEGVTLAYRNFEGMTDEEIQEFLEKHILLKLQAESDRDKSK